MLTVRFPDSEVWGSGFDVNEDSYGHDDDGDHSALVDDDGLPENSHKSYSHQVGIRHNDERWEYDTVKYDKVKFPPCTNPSSIYK